MQTIPNVATSDAYSSACTLEDPNAVAGTYVVANAAVIAKFRAKNRDGTLAPYGPELLLSPQSNNVVGCGGMAFRSAAVGVPAQVIAALYDARDPLPGAATPFSQTISSSGTVTPGVAAVQVQKDGALIGTEPILDFLTASNGNAGVLADDAANTRVTVSIPRVTVGAWVSGPPVAPSDGDIWVAVNVDANGTRWTFQYYAGSASAYKWEFVGGGALYAEVATLESGNLAAGWSDLATIGPRVTGLRAGDYYALGVCRTTNGAGADNPSMGLCLGATVPSFSTAITIRTGGDQAPLVIAGEFVGIAAASEIRMRYTNGNQTDSWQSRSVAVTPRRIA